MLVSKQSEILVNYLLIVQNFHCTGHTTPT